MRSPPCRAGVGRASPSARSAISILLPAVRGRFSPPGACSGVCPAQDCRPVTATRTAWSAAAGRLAETGRPRCQTCAGVRPSSGCTEPRGMSAGWVTRWHQATPVGRAAQGCLAVTTTSQLAPGMSACMPTVRRAAGPGAGGVRNRGALLETWCCEGQNPRCGQCGIPFPCGFRESRQYCCAACRTRAARTAKAQREANQADGAALRAAPEEHRPWHRFRCPERGSPWYSAAQAPFRKTERSDSQHAVSGWPAQVVVRALRRLAGTAHCRVTALGQAKASWFTGRGHTQVPPTGRGRHLARTGRPAGGCGVSAG